MNWNRDQSPIDPGTPAPQPLDHLRPALDIGALRPLDLHLARWLARVADGASPGCLLAAALASQRVGQGDVCLDLAELAGRAPFPELPDLLAPPLASWRAELAAWPAVAAADPDPSAAVHAPLVLDSSHRLYLGRYWHYERNLAQAVTDRAWPWSRDLDLDLLRLGLDRLFGPRPEVETDWQRLAAALALLKPLCVISGGPGTGKTRTVTAILALVLEQARAVDTRPRMALAAPTGKAAARLTESIRQAKEQLLAELAIDADLAAAIPQEAQTLHRLLGTRPGRVIPRQGPDNPLHLDLLVVDEASMLDLPLAAHLLAALPLGCRLILLGDRDQLASVQAGAVLGDLCARGREPAYSPALMAALGEVGAAAPSHPQLGLDLDGPPANGRPASPLRDCIALLRKSYRFKAGSGIHALAAAIHRGDGRGALAVLESRPQEVRLIEIAARLDPRQAEARLAGFIADFLIPRYRLVLAQPDPAAALQALGTFRILCAVREGPFGLANLNRLAERALAAAGLIRPEGGRYPGRPLLVSANDYDLRLFNGDLGLLLPDPQAPGGSSAWFETAEGLRRLSPHRLPQVETLFAMTVHKSQGSEFDQVVLVLPRHPSRALTRELIYTGVTRARAQITLVAPAERLIEGVARRSERSSGLYDRLWG